MDSLRRRVLDTCAALPFAEGTFLVGLPQNVRLALGGAEDHERTPLARLPGRGRQLRTSLR
jgi:hypothetical protein